MNQNHAAFFKKPVGRKLEAVIRQAHERYGFVLMSLTKQPAINAVTWELDPIIAGLPPSQRGHAKQACGALVGDIMINEVKAERATTRSGRARSKRIVGSRLFTMGAVWTVPSGALEAATRPLRTA